MSEESKIPEPPKYRPIFPDIIISLKAYIESRISDFNFAISSSVSKLPCLAIENIETQLASSDDAFDPRHGTFHRGSMSLKMYVPHDELARYYDIIVNLLFGWSSESGFIDLRVERKVLYPIKEEMDVYVVGLQVSIMYQDFLADTTYPLVSQDNCVPCIDTIGAPQGLRIEKVKVISETHV